MISEANRALAHVLAPVLLWMAAGWAAFPFGIARLLDIVEEENGSPLMPLVPFVIAAAFLFAGVEAYIIGSTYSPTAGSPQVRRKTTMKCPYCFERIYADERSCPFCGMWIPR